MKELTKGRIICIFVGFVFAVIGVGLIISGNKNEKKYKEFNNKAKTVVAYVDEVYKHTTTKRKTGKSSSKRNRTKTTTTYTGYMTYEVDGVQYYRVAVDEADNLKEGENYTIYYNPDNPKDISLSLYNVETIGLQYRIGGIICIVIGGITVVAALFGEERRA